MNVVSIIQVALTPVFLLAGMAGFLNVFATRLARVSDRVNLLTDELTSHKGQDAEAETWRVGQLYYLRKRTLALECAVIFIIVSGILTCIATFGLLIGTIKEDLKEQLLLWFFGSAIVTLAIAFVAFLVEMAAAGSSMLRQIEIDHRLIRKRRQTLVPVQPRSNPGGLQ